MIKRTIMWALMCLTATVVCAQICETVDDCFPDSMLLDEIVVNARREIHKTDRRLVFPDKQTIASATDGIDLLQKLHLPRLSVNPLYGTISLSGGGSVRLLINGVEVTSSELGAVRPDEIVRIEYHDMPGARYGEASAVLNYITTRKTSGAHINLDSFNAIGNGKWASINNLSAQYNRGQAMWSMNVDYMGQRRSNWIRDYKDLRNYPTHSVVRLEEGLPVSIGNSGLESHLNYNITEGGRFVFNTRLNFDWNHVPAKEEGDRRSKLYISGCEYPLSIYEHTHERSVHPSLNLYLQRNLTLNQKLTFDITASWLKSESHHHYNESLSDNISVTDIISDVSGDKYTLSAESFYELKYRAINLTVGMRHMQSHTANHYSGSNQADISIVSAESAAYGDISCRLGKIGLTANLTALRLHYRQGDNSTTRLSLSPAISLSFEPMEQFFLRYGAKMRNQMPSLAMMSKVEQTIESDLVRRGNPHLKPFRVIEQELSASTAFGILGLDLTTSYRHEHHPVMESTVFEDGIFVKTYENQRSFRQLSFETTLSLRPWRDHLTLSLSPLVYRFLSRGNSYFHSNTLFRLRYELDLNWKNWLLSCSTMTGPANSMYGEELIEEKDMNMIVAGYKQSKWSVQAGVFNAFMKEYYMKSKNFSALTPSVSRAHCNKNCYAVVKFSLSLDFGHVKKAADIPADSHENPESGIMTGVK